VSLLLIFILVPGKQCLHGIRKTWTFIRSITCISESKSKIELLKFRCWYGVPPEEHMQFQEFAGHHFPEAAKECSEFLRHKTFLINPLNVRSNGMTVHKCIQNPGEFVITKCGAYHAGFNMGYNCAEAVNFAIKSWLEFGKKSQVCKCESDSVKIDMKQFLSNVTEDKKRISQENTGDHSEDEPVVLSGKKRMRSDTNAAASKKRIAIKKIKKSTDNKKTTTKQRSVDNWLCCDQCNKWRKIPKGKLRKLIK
jgi:hypothetical protein